MTEFTQNLPSVSSPARAIDPGPIASPLSGIGQTLSSIAGSMQRGRARQASAEASAQDARDLATQNEVARRELQYRADRERELEKEAVALAERAESDQQAVEQGRMSQSSAQLRLETWAQEYTRNNPDQAHVLRVAMGERGIDNFIFRSVSQEEANDAQMEESNAEAYRLAIETYGEDWAAGHSDEYITSRGSAIRRARNQVETHRADWRFNQEVDQAERAAVGRAYVASTVDAISTEVSPKLDQVLTAYAEASTDPERDAALRDVPVLRANVEANYSRAISEAYRDGLDDSHITRLENARDTELARLQVLAGDSSFRGVIEEASSLTEAEARVNVLRQFPEAALWHGLGMDSATISQLVNLSALANREGHAANIRDFSNPMLTPGNPLDRALADATDPDAPPERRAVAADRLSSSLPSADQSPELLNFHAGVMGNLNRAVVRDPEDTRARDSWFTNIDSWLNIAEQEIVPGQTSLTEFTRTAEFLLSDELQAALGALRETDPIRARGVTNRLIEAADTLLIQGRSPDLGWTGGAEANEGYAVRFNERTLSFEHEYTGLEPNIGFMGEAAYLRSPATPNRLRGVSEGQRQHIAALNRAAYFIVNNSDVLETHGGDEVAALRYVVSGQSSGRFAPERPEDTLGRLSHLQSQIHAAGREEPIGRVLSARIHEMLGAEALEAEGLTVSADSRLSSQDQHTILALASARIDALEALPRDFNLSDSAPTGTSTSSGVNLSGQPPKGGSQNDGISFANPPAPSTLGQAPIVRPGAPGEASQRITAQEALSGSDRAGIEFSEAPASDIRGIRNNNPGNIEAGADWEGVVGDDGRFATFQSPEHGIRALARTLRVYSDVHGINTVEGIINRWAPPTENDTGSYVNHVADAVGVEPDAEIDVNDEEVLVPLVEAIIRHENGEQPYEEEVIRRGVGLSGRRKSRGDTSKQNDDNIAPENPNYYEEGAGQVPYSVRRAWEQMKGEHDEVARLRAAGLELPDSDALEPLPSVRSGEVSADLFLEMVSEYLEDPKKGLTPELLNLTKEYQEVYPGSRTESPVLVLEQMLYYMRIGQRMETRTEVSEITQGRGRPSR